MSVKDSLKNENSLIIWFETSMFTIQSNLRILLINFLNKTTISFIFFSLFELISKSLKLLLSFVENSSTLYVFCLCLLTYLSSLFLIFFCFFLRTFSTFVTIRNFWFYNSRRIKNIFFLNLSLTSRLRLRVERRAFSSKFKKCR